MSLKERLLKFYNENKQAIANLLIALLFALLGLGGGYELGQRNPDPAVVETLMRARATPTPAATKARVTATSTPIPSATPAATFTPTLIISPTPTSILVGHDVSVWHEPGFAGHQHGLKPMDAHPAIVTWLNTHPWGPLFSSIGTLWGSSPVENLFPWPLGKHEGFINLGEVDTHCDLYKQPPATSGACIKAYLFQVHALGNADEFRVPVHSDKFVALVCARNNESQCGIVATGGLANYGERHALYKNVVCPLGSNPPYPPNLSGDQPPYITVNGSARKFMFWSTLTNPIIEPYFPDPPNKLFQAAWNNRPFSTPSLNDCADPGSDIEHTNPENRNNTFQVFFLKLLIANLPRPFEGYTDAHGNVDEACTAPSASCVPLYIGAGVPAGVDALLNRQVNHGDPEAAPIQVYGADALLLPPGDTTP